MTFKKEDILDALGIQRDSNWLPTALAGFGVGCLVGATVALMLAPKSGRELRGDILDKGRDLIGKGREFVGRESEGLGGMPKSSNTPSY
jgi:gas vesicle protein